jgi:feruloyl esterase
LHSYADAGFQESAEFEPSAMFHSDDASFEALDVFFRLFRVPGMFHCNSGPGAWVLGQGGGAAAVGIPYTPEQNVLAALVEWVEEGKAPETIGGVKFVDDVVGNGLATERRHCRWVFGLLPNSFPSLLLSLRNLQSRSNALIAL